MEPQSALVLCAALACIAGPVTAAILVVPVLAAVRKVAEQHFENQAAAQSANIDLATRKLTMEERRFDHEMLEKQEAQENRAAARRAHRMINPEGR